MNVGMEQQEQIITKKIELVYKTEQIATKESSTVVEEDTSDSDFDWDFYGEDDKEKSASGLKLSSFLDKSPDTANQGETRIVLLGKTGSGKSATGNTLLGKEFFESKIAGQSVTKECCRGESLINERKMVVVDTPGLFDTKLSPEKIKESIIRCVYMSVPGPHVFLIVLRLGRFTAEEVDTLTQLFEIFGEGMGSCSIVVFTGSEDLEADGSIETFIEETGKPLKKYISYCKGRYIAIDNKAQSETKSFMMKRLIHLIDATIKENEGKSFSNECFQLVNNVISQAVENLKKSINENIKESKPNAFEKIGKEQKRLITEVIEKITDDALKKIASIMVSITENENEIKMLKMKRDEAIGDIKLRKSLSDQIDKLVKQTRNLIRQQDQCASSMIRNANFIQKQLTRKSKMCPIM